MSHTSKVPHRCAGKLPGGDRCLKRHTFAHEWTWYVRKRKCSCGSEKFWIEVHRRNRKDRKNCNCPGYHYTHQKGSEPWCDHAKNGPTALDIEYRTLN